MKIRHPMIVKMVGFAVACLVRVWIGLVRYRYRSAWAEDAKPTGAAVRGRYLYAFWHEDLMHAGVPLRPHPRPRPHQ